MKAFWGKAAGVTEAAKLTGYSRASLHTWKRNGCPAFAADGVVDLSALSAWLSANCLGMRGAGEDDTARTRPEPVYFAGGRDYAAELEGLHNEARRFREILEEAGHAALAEKWWTECYYAKVRPALDEFIAHLEKTGLAEPLGD